MVVLPAASSPTIRIRTSFLPSKFAKILDRVRPIVPDGSGASVGEGRGEEKEKKARNAGNLEGDLKDSFPREQVGQDLDRLGKESPA